jgi:hypothetical protein
MSKRSILVSVATALAVVIAATPLLADSYYLYVNWNPGVQYTTGVNGYVDVTGAIEGIPGGEYLFFVGGPSYGGNHTAYIYRVDTAGDPNMHPSNPDATGPIAPRTFTFVSSHYLGNFYAGHENAFYVDDTGIYYGAAQGWGGIFHWDFHWNPIGWEVATPAPSGSQTLARNPDTGQWWVGLANRYLYRWDGSSWVYQFTHPSLGGGHHDGMEIIGGSLFISDMTSDMIIQYRLDVSGDPIDPPGSPHATFTYSASPPVEGMGYGPNKHIWISGWQSYTVYEIGGGALQVALEGIPDQCVASGGTFDTFDLDDYAVGVPPFSWTWSGDTNIEIAIDPDNVVTLTYPEGWLGAETITFMVTDALGRSAGDNATFTVAPVPIVGDIPDQTSPFAAFDLDDYLTGIDAAQVTWSAAGMSCLQVVIDAVTHVVTVSNPGDACTAPETITFTATAIACDDTVSSADDATFTPILPVVLDVKPGSCPNPLNIKPFLDLPENAKVKKGGVLPVAILGTEEFDVRDVDVTTLLLEGVEPLRYNYADVATPVVDPAECECTMAGADGYEDLTLKFQKSLIVAALGTLGDGDVIPLTITGSMLDGTPIEGFDCVRIISEKEHEPVVLGVVLNPAVPNPFNPMTRITYAVPTNGPVSLSIYDIAGHLVDRLVDRTQPAGEYVVEWNAKDFPSGIYFSRLDACGVTKTGKMILLK